METIVKESKFGDIILWNKTKKKFVVVRNYYKLPNLLKTNDYEICCMSLRNGSFISLNEPNEVYNWEGAMERAKFYKGSAPIKSYLPSRDELKAFYPLFNEFNNKIIKLQTLGVNCNKVKYSGYWSSTEYDNIYARFLDIHNGDVFIITKNHYLFLRPFVDF